MPCNPAYKYYFLFFFLLMSDKVLFLLMNVSFQKERVKAFFDGKAKRETMIVLRGYSFNFPSLLSSEKKLSRFSPVACSKAAFISAG